MSKSAEAAQFSSQANAYSMKSKLAKSQLEDTVSKFVDHLPHITPSVSAPHASAHLDPLMPQIPPISNIMIDTSLPHYESVKTTELVSVSNDTSALDSADPDIICYIPPSAYYEHQGFDVPNAPIPYPTPVPEPVGVTLDDGGFTISIDAEGTIICATPPGGRDPLVPLAPEQPGPTGGIHLNDGGFTVYLDENGNAVCGFPPSPTQTAINDFLDTTTVKSHAVVDQSADQPAGVSSFAEIHGNFELPVNSDAV